MINKTLVMTNTAAYLAAKVVIVLTLVHFMWTVSYIHAIIVIMSYLVMEVLNIQLHAHMKKGLVQRPPLVPELKIVTDALTDNDDEKGTTH